MKKYILVPTHLVPQILILMTILHPGHGFPPDVYDPRYELVLPGDVNIGAILSIHRSLEPPMHARDTRQQPENRDRKRPSKRDMRGVRNRRDRDSNIDENVTHDRDINDVINVNLHASTKGPLGKSDEGRRDDHGEAKSYTSDDTGIHSRSILNRNGVSCNETSYPIKGNSQPPCVNGTKSKIAQESGSQRIEAESLEDHVKIGGITTNASKEKGLDHSGHENVKKAVNSSSLPSRVFNVSSGSANVSKSRPALLSHFYGVKGQTNLFHRSDEMDNEDDTDEDERNDDLHDQHNASKAGSIPGPSPDATAEEGRHQPVIPLYCDQLLANFQAVENAVAILFALDEINSRDDILPNTTLGVTILDDCFSESLALARAFQFMPAASTIMTRSKKSKREVKRFHQQRLQTLRKVKRDEDSSAIDGDGKVDDGVNIPGEVTSDSRTRVKIKCSRKIRSTRSGSESPKAVSAIGKIDEDNVKITKNGVDQENKIPSKTDMLSDGNTNSRKGTAMIKNIRDEKMQIKNSAHRKRSDRMPSPIRHRRRLFLGDSKIPPMSRREIEDNDSMCATELPSHDQRFLGSRRSVWDRLPPFYDVIGIIGAYTSSLSVVVADVMTLFNMPQISHASTTDSLSDKTKYPVFFRTLPADRFLVKAMADLLGHFNWTYVSIVFSADAYGTEAEKRLTTLLREMDICVARRIALLDNMKPSEYDKVIENLRASKNARVVALYADIKHIQPLMTAVKRQKASREFIWAGSDTTSIVSSMDEENCRHMLGSFSVTMYSDVSPKFGEYLNSFLLKHKEVLDRISDIDHIKKTSSIFKYPSSLEGSRNIVSSSSGIDLKAYTPTFTVRYAIDAVYAYAHAIQNFVDINCPDATGAKVKQCLHGRSILPFLRNVSFRGSSGKVCFNDKGDVVGNIAINQCQIHEGVAKQVPVAIWDMNKKKEALQFLAHTMWPNSTFAPKSLCAEPCGYREIYTFPKQTCCWTCVRCQPNEALDVKRTHCQACDLFSWPDELTPQLCNDIKRTFISLRDIVPLVLAIVTTIGLMMSVITAFTFFTYRTERIIRSSSRELSAFMMIGVILAFLLQYSLLSPPTNLTCYCNQVGFPLTFTLVYGPLLVKTNRIYRIFTAGTKSAALPKWTSSASQLLFASSFILVQVIIVTLSTSLAPPSVEDLMPDRMKKYVIRYCDLPLAGFIPALSFNFVLVLVCTWYAFKTRRLPDNYNESRYIAFCVDTTVLVWISFIPTYFAITRPYFKAVVLAVALLINSAVCLLCLFVPKMYGLYVYKRHGPGVQSRGTGCGNGGDIHIQMASNLSMTGLIRSTPSVVESSSSKERTISHDYEKRECDPRMSSKTGGDRTSGVFENAAKNHHGQEIHFLISTDGLVNRSSEHEASASSSEHSEVIS